MNKKGQLGVGGLIMIAIGVIVGSIFLVAVAQSVGETTNTVDLVNGSYTATANGEVFYVTNYKAINDISIMDAGGETITSGNYTAENDAVYNGALAVKITVDDAAFESQEWLISGTAEPLTYISDSGGRAMSSLIVVMFALAVLAIALAPVIKEGMANLG